ncbi:MAG: PhzF family phenazine biosynthesis protein [Myxococcota bacterium]
MDLPCFQVDAFTSQPFRGNPAAVCVLPRWLPDALLQAVAAEMNLSETAFIVAEDRSTYHLRWFTPTTEVDLCGHATLASAFVVSRALAPQTRRVVFHAPRAGCLPVVRDGDALVLDFPALPPASVSDDRTDVARALGRPAVAYASNDDTIVARFGTQSEVAALSPDMAKLSALARFVVATAPGEPGSDADFVSRFFAPHVGVDEDPVTGSAHCVLAPFWAHRLNRTTLEAQQISRRGGGMRCTLVDDRVLLRGHAVLVMTGTLTLPDHTVAPTL